MNIISKIKEKGVCGCIMSIRYRIIRIYNMILFARYASLPVDEHMIVLESEGDCCDNAYALFDFMKQNGYVGRYSITWLVEHPENFHEEDNISYVKKNIDRYFCAKTIHALSICHWYIYDHCNMLAGRKRKTGQSVSYLCHGYAGFKSPKGYGVFQADEEFTTGEIPVQGCIDWHGTKSKKYILGFPRLDYFSNYKCEYRDLARQIIEGEGFFKTFLWMPTFRQSFSKELSEDYIINETGLPLFNTIESMKTMNDYLKKLNIKIVMKIHHLQAGLDIFSIKFSNIQFLTDEDLSKYGLQLYQFIPIFDALITDYSSISTDYFLLDKPIIYILDDIDEYKKARGLYPDNALDYMPGDHVKSISELKASVERILQGEDKYRKERNEIVSLFHTYRDGNASKRILEHLGINL